MQWIFLSILFGVAVASLNDDENEPKSLQQQPSNRTLEVEDSTNKEPENISNNRTTRTLHHHKKGYKQEAVEIVQVVHALPVQVVQATPVQVIQATPIQVIPAAPVHAIQAAPTVHHHEPDCYKPGGHLGGHHDLANGHHSHHGHHNGGILALHHKLKARLGALHAKHFGAGAHHSLHGGHHSVLGSHHSLHGGHDNIHGGHHTLVTGQHGAHGGHHALHSIHKQNIEIGGVNDAGQTRLDGLKELLAYKHALRAGKLSGRKEKVSPCCAHGPCCPNSPCCPGKK